LTVEKPHFDIARRKFVTACAIGEIVLASLALTGWAVDAPRVTSVFPGWVRIDPTSAALFIACGIALLFQSTSSILSRVGTLAISAAMVIIGGAKDIGYLFGQNLPVDRLLFWSSFGYSGSHQGACLAPNTSVCFVLVGLALPFFALGKGSVTWPNAAIVLALTIGIASFLGFAFTASTVTAMGPNAPMAVPANICFLLLGSASIALRPNIGIAKLFTDSTSGSVLVRRLLPVAVLAPFMIGVVRLFAEHHHLLTSAVASALAIVAAILFIVYLILSTAMTLNVSDARRLDAEQQTQRLSERLREEAAKSEAANRSKSLFLANMSHEIRTPLNGVLGTSELLAMRDLDADSQRLIGVVRSSGETLLRVINDILDFSKIEAGKLEIERVPTSLTDLVHDIVVLYRAQAEARGITIAEIVPDHGPPTVLADPIRIKQILANLITNAVKFTSAGGVYVSLEFTETGYGRIHSVLTVKDTGIGIALDRQAVIFDHFTQVDESTHRRFGGTGLGLAICKRLVELMGGELSLSSQPGEGSVFQVRLDLQKADAGENVILPLELTDFPSGIRILLAEDNEVNAMVASAMLDSLGCTAMVVGDGLSAIAAVSSNQFDAVLMDIHMPVCDGLEATRAIRQIPEVANIKIIALTASALSEDRKACLDAGMDGFLSKPFTRDTLAAALSSELDRA
jgi:signal transduction histidine kinase/CheY-like chemotaxis protein